MCFCAYLLQLQLTGWSNVDRDAWRWSGDVQRNYSRYVDGHLLQSSGACKSTIVRAESKIGGEPAGQLRALPVAAKLDSCLEAARLWCSTSGCRVALTRRAIADRTSSRRRVDLMVLSRYVCVSLSEKDGVQVAGTCLGA